MSYGFNIRTDVTYIGNDYYRTTCLECGTEFTTKRRDAKYHDPNCRKRANRRQRKILTDANVVVAIVRDLQQMEKRPDLRSEVAAAMQTIRAALQT